MYNIGTLLHGGVHFGGIRNMRVYQNRGGSFCLAALILVFLTLPMLFVGCGEGAETPEKGTQTASGSPVVVSLPTTETTEATTETTAAPQPVVVSFMGLGDNLIHPNLYDFADRSAGEFGDGTYDFKVFFETVKPDIDEADIAFINQETLSAGDELGLSGYPNFNTPRAMIFQLAELGFDLIGMANNHVLDKGVRGIYHALYNWSKTECVFSGINADPEMREAIPVLEREGVKFAFLAYTSHTNGIGADTDWRVNYMDAEAIARDVAKAKELADFVIVSAHWGWDDVFEIDGYQREYAEVFAKAGVDLVVGTGPHLIQHIEWYDREDGGKMLCAFSLGNYVSGMSSPFNELTGVLKLNFVKEADGAKSLRDVVFSPIVMHKETGDGVMGVYRLKDYTDELAARSSINYFTGGLSVEYLYRILREQIADEFLPQEYRRQAEQ